MNTIKIKGKNYKLRFGMRAKLQFEEQMGVSLMSLTDYNSMMLKDIIELCYIVLIDGGSLSDDEDKDWLLDRLTDDPGLMGKIISGIQDKKKKA